MQLLKIMCKILSFVYDMCSHVALILIKHTELSIFLYLYCSHSYNDILHMALTIYIHQLAILDSSNIPSINLHGDLVVECLVPVHNRF